MISIVQHNVRCVATPLQFVDSDCEPFRDCIRRRQLPICSHRIPKHRGQPLLARRAKHRRPARSKRRTKIFHSNACDLLQRITRALQFLPHATCCSKSKVRMAPGMIADQVAGCNNPPHQLRLGLRMAAHQKKRRLHVVAAKNLQQPRSPHRIRTIVEGQRQFAWARRRNQRFAKNPRPRPQCGISASAPRKRGHAHSGRKSSHDW